MDRSGAGDQPIAAEGVSMAGQRRPARETKPREGDRPCVKYLRPGCSAQASYSSPTSSSLTSKSVPGSLRAQRMPGGIRVPCASRRCGRRARCWGARRQPGWQVGSDVVTCIVEAPRALDLPLNPAGPCPPAQIGARPEGHRHRLWPRRTLELGDGGWRAAAQPNVLCSSGTYCLSWW